LKTKLKNTSGKSIKEYKQAIKHEFKIKEGGFDYKKINQIWHAYENLRMSENTSNLNTVMKNKIS